MILALELFILSLLFLVPIYWAIPARLHNLRLTLLGVFSAIILYSLNPIILLGVGAYAAFIYGVLRYASGGPKQASLAKKLAWGGFILLPLPELFAPELVSGLLLGNVDLLSDRTITYTYLGLSYTAIRSFLLIHQSIADRQYSLGNILTALLFLPSFVVGPMSGGRIYRQDQVAPSLTLEAGMMGVARIGIGLAMFLVIAPILYDFDFKTLGITSEPALVWLKTSEIFVAVYFDFAGICNVAIGWAMLFGIKLPENFNYPFVARSIQEFWQRWHMTFGKRFVSLYIFKPLVRQTGRPQLAMFFAFAFVGVWHTMSLGYVLWGVMHGGALALNMYWSRNVSPKIPRYIQLPLQPVYWFLTMGYVVFVSNVALSGDWESIKAYLASIY